MADLRANLDIELLQATWILGGMEPDQLVQLAVSALQQGFNGTALRQVFLACALFGCTICRPVLAQQPTQAPSFRVPDPIHLHLPVSPKTDSAPPEIERLPDLAARLLHHAADAGCHKDNCKILVTDFAFPDGTTFPNGIQWADDLSSLFANKETSIHVADRTQFKDFLKHERIPPGLQSSEVTARWLGRQFNATVVLVGQAKMIREDVVQLSARFLNVIVATQI